MFHGRSLFSPLAAPITAMKGPEQLSCLTTSVGIMYYVPSIFPTHNASAPLKTLDQVSTRVGTLSAHRSNAARRERWKTPDVAPTHRWVRRCTQQGPEVDLYPTRKAKAKGFWPREQQTRKPPLMLPNRFRSLAVTEAHCWKRNNLGPYCYFDPTQLYDQLLVFCR